MKVLSLFVLFLFFTSKSYSYVGCPGSGSVGHRICCLFFGQGDSNCPERNLRMADLSDLDISDGLNSSRLNNQQKNMLRNERSLRQKKLMNIKDKSSQK
jgi:hypothetical protein